MGGGIKRLNNIVHMRKIPRLISISHYGQCLSMEFLGKKQARGL